MTKKQMLYRILNIQWQNIKVVKFDSARKNFTENLLQKDWQKLEELDLSSSEITQSEIELVVKEYNWPQLKHLNLSSNKTLDDEGFEILCKGDWPLLETLNLDNTRITKKKLLYFMLNLKWPNLKGVQIGGKNFAENLFQKDWHQLQKLDLAFGGITQGEIELIVKNYNLPQLKHLDLFYNYEVSDEALEILAQADWPLLETLSLGSTQITKKGLLIFLLKTNWANLQEIHFHRFLGDVGSLLPKNWSLLEKLGLCSCDITKDEIEVIVTRSNWPQLKHLNLSSNKTLDDEGFEILCKGDWPLLETLDLDGTGITKKRLLYFMLNIKWPHLKEIKFNSHSGKNFAENLLPKNWHQLQELDLSYGKITQSEIDLIVKNYNLPQLKHLNLSHNEGVSDEALEILAQADWPLLETIDLSTRKITKKGLVNFLLETNLPNLQDIQFHRSERNFVKSLLPKDYWPLLEKLDLRECGITKDEIEVIVTKSNLPQLKHLNLSDNSEIHDDGIQILIQGDWPLLEILNLASTGITALGIEIIKSQAKWPHLKSLDIARNYRISGERLQRLAQEDWPGLETLVLQGINFWWPELVKLLLNLNWPNLKEILFDSFLSHSDPKRREFPKGLLPQNWSEVGDLDLRDLEITQNEIKGMVYKCKWPKLKRLDLSSNSSIGDEGVTILSQGDWPLLETLDLRAMGLTEKVFSSFLLNSNWPNFKEIILPYNFDDADRDIALILVHKKLDLIERLELGDSKVTLAEIEALLLRNRYQCPQLKYLNLSNNRIFDEGKIFALLVAGCPLLEELHIENTGIGPEGIKAIVNRSKWPQFKHLNISNNDILDEGISFLVSAEWPLLKNLNLSQTRLSIRGIEKIVSQSKWPQMISHLNISNNEVFDEGISVLSFTEWRLLEELEIKNTKVTAQGVEILVNKAQLPNLKKLDVSENDIFDEGLKMVTEGKWPLFEHLVYFGTKVTIKGHIAFLESFKWPNFHKIEHSLNESFYNQNQSEDVLAIVPMDYMGEPTLVTVLNATWLNSKEIHLSIKGDLNETITILPRDKLNQLEKIKLEFSASSMKLRMWPQNLKTLYLDWGSFWGEEALEEFEGFSQKCPLLENLCFDIFDRWTKALEILIQKSDWPNLKKLYLLNSKIQNEGLAILASAKWPLLETVHFRDGHIRPGALESLIQQSSWPNLKELDLSYTKIKDEGIEILVAADWPLLENLGLESTGITGEGIQSLVSKSNWPHLKRLDVSDNEIGDEGLEILVCGKWNLLEYLSIRRLDITNKGIEALTKKPEWPNLRKLDASNNKIQDEGLEILTCGKWPLLEHIVLRSLDISSQGIQILIGSRANWSNLKKLEVAGNPIGNKGIEILVSSDWPLLEDLGFEKTEITDEGLEILTRKSNWPNLKGLNISGNEIHDEGLGILAHGKWPLLERLYLDSLEITEKGLTSIASISEWPNLKLIDLSYNENIGEKGLGDFALGKWPFLETLYLRDLSLEWEDLETLAKKSSWPKIKELDLARFRYSFYDSDRKVLKGLLGDKWPLVEIGVERSTSVFLPQERFKL